MRVIAVRAISLLGAGLEASPLAAVPKFSMT